MDDISENNLITNDEWEKELKSQKVSKLSMNKLIMNYLALEGYSKAVDKFQQEAGIIKNDDDLFWIEERKQIRQLIQDDMLDEATDKINDLCPQILELRSDLHFQLLKHKLINLIKEDQIEKAISFAQHRIAPLTIKYPEFLKEIEQVMTLLAYQNPKSSPDAQLLEYSHRHMLASQINEAILKAQCKQYEKKLPLVIKLMLHSQNKLAEKVKIPKITDVSIGKLDTII